MKINSFNFSNNNSIVYKNNLRKCSEIFENLFNNKENFFFNTLSQEYQKNLFLKKIVLKKRINKTKEHPSLGFVISPIQQDTLCFLDGEN